MEKLFQKVPKNIVSRCEDFGHHLAAHYRSGGSPQSRARSGGRGTEYNPERLGSSKVGECAAAIVLGLDVDTSIKFSVDRPDKGFDLVIEGCLKLDSKTTWPYRKLIWSRTINDLFWDKNFDAIVSVTLDRRDWTRAWIDGYIWKLQFFANKKISDGVNSPLEPGTWFVDKGILCPISDLRRV